MEKKLKKLFDWDYNRLFDFSHDKIFHTYQTEETEKVFDEKLTHCFDSLIIESPAMCSLDILGDLSGDCTTQGYIVNSTDEFKQLFKNTTKQLVDAMKNLIVNCNDDRRITSWGGIDYRKFRNGGYEGRISIRYKILSQPDERGASIIYREYRYLLKFRTTRKDFSF